MTAIIIPKLTAIIIPKMTAIIIPKFLQFCKRQFFAVTPMTPKFRGGDDFHNINHSKIHEIRPSHPKSDCIIPIIYRHSIHKYYTV